jgi:hypothetical protein
MLSRSTRITLLLSVSHAAAGIVHAQCQTGLTNLGLPVGLTSTPSAALMHDFDGPGPLPPELFVIADSSLAAWNGATWRKLANLSGTSFSMPLAAHDFDGDGTDVSRLVTAHASLNTVQAYGPLGTPLTIPGTFSNRISSLLSFDQDGSGPASAQLIAAGNFTSIATPTFQNRNRIASWDGATWSNLGTGLNSDVQTLELWDADGEGPQPALLVAGGRFSGPNIGQRGVATWNGSTWSYLAFPSNATVSEIRDLTTWDHDGIPGTPRRLVAVGAFSMPLPTGFRNVAVWTGASWEALSTLQPLSAVDSVATLAPLTPQTPERLAIAGAFSIAASSVSISGVAVFANGTWQPLGAGFVPQADLRVIVDTTTPANRITVLGPFTTVPGNRRVNHATQWNGTAWRSMPDTDDANLSRPVRFAFDLVTASAERVLVAVVEEGSLSRLYRRDASGWQPVGDPLAYTSAVKWTPSASNLPQVALAVPGSVITTDGFSVTTVATISSASDIRLAVRETPAGQRLLAAANQRVYSISPAGLLSQLGGQFNTADIVLTGWDHDANATTPDHILATGGFTSIAGQPFLRVARWNDAAWVNIGAIEVNQPANVNIASDITAWNHDNNPLTPDVPVCLGAFQYANANDTEVNGLAQWNGSQWVPLPAGRPRTGGGPERLYEWDRDGPGRPGLELVASSGGQAWSLSTQGVWQPVDGDGTSLFAVVGVVSNPAGATQPDALFISRHWSLPRNPSSPAAALFVGGCRTCGTIDFNNNGVFPEDQDVIDFFDAFAAQPCPTCSGIDFNDNGVFPEDQDVIDFFNVLAGGACP